jgi:formylglycine-generating enzyme required for sulfatase activity
MQEDRLKPDLPEGALRVFRGGSWRNSAQDARVADRDRFDPALRFGNLGFRIVFDSNHQQGEQHEKEE